MCNFQWENHFFPFSRYDKQKMTAQLILSIHFFISFFLFVRTPADHHLHLSHIIMQFVFDYQAYGVCVRARLHLHLCQCLSLCGFSTCLSAIQCIHMHSSMFRENQFTKQYNAFRAFLLVFVFVFKHFYGFVLFDIKCINEST